MVSGNSRVSGDGQADADTGQLRVVALFDRHRLPRRRLHLHGHRPRLLDVLHGQPARGKKMNKNAREGDKGKSSHEENEMESSQVLIISPPRVKYFDATHFLPTMSREK